MKNLTDERKMEIDLSLKINRICIVDSQEEIAYIMKEWFKFNPVVGTTEVYSKTYNCVRIDN